MHRLRSLWVAAPTFLCACSLINAPAEIDPGTTATGGTGGTTATGGTTSTSSDTGATGGSTVTTVCGDGKVQGDEKCDDDNPVGGDGCDASCEVEDGWACTAPAEELSVCELLCGNGTVDTDEECDDKGAVNVAPPDGPEGDEDYCTPDCKFKEFDVEAAKNAADHNELPAIGYRRDNAESAFVVMWHTAATSKISSRHYRFNGAPVGPAEEYGISASPDVAGEVICTGDSNRSLVFWRDSGEHTIYSRKIESNDALLPPVVTTIPDAQPKPSCAVSPAVNNNTFIVATVGKPAGALFDVFVQPFTPAAQVNGAPNDIGDTLQPNDTVSWALSNGFMVGWIADPLGNGPIIAQQLNNTGGVIAGSLFTITDQAVDKVAREPAASRIGMQDGFVFVYSRDSAPDPMGMTHREIVLRSFSSPGSGAPPLVVSSSSNPKGEPRIAVNPANNKFIIIWTDESPSPGNKNIVYRTFDTPGSMGSEEKVANDNQVGSQTAGGVTVDPATGNVAIVWDNFTPNAGKPHKVTGKVLAGLLK